MALYFTRKALTKFKNPAEIAIGCRKSLFTDEFLGIEVFKQKRDQALREAAAFRDGPSGGVACFRQNVLQQSRAGEGLLSSDVRNLIYTCGGSVGDLAEIGDVIRKFVLNEENGRDDASNVPLQRRKGHLFKDFMSLCHVQGRSLEAAQVLWTDRSFMEALPYISIEDSPEESLSSSTNRRQLAVNMPTITLIYLDMAFKKGQYDLVVAEAQALEKALGPPAVPPFVYCLAFMACLRLNSPESLKAATNFYNNHSSDLRPENGGFFNLWTFSKVVNPYAMLLCLQGNHKLAFEVVSLLPRKTVLRTGLLVFILSRLNRPQEACALLENVARLAEHSPYGDVEGRSSDLRLAGSVPGMEKIVFSVETVRALTNAVEARKDLALNSRLSSLFARLDRVASITDKNLVDLIAGDIDAPRSMKHRRKKNRMRQQRLAETSGSAVVSRLIDDPATADDLEDIQAEFLDDRDHRGGEGSLRR